MNRKKFDSKNWVEQEVRRKELQERKNQAHKQWVAAQKWWADYESREFSLLDQMELERKYSGEALEEGYLVWLIQEFENLEKIGERVKLMECENEELKKNVRLSLEKRLALHISSAITEDFNINMPEFDIKKVDRSNELIHERRFLGEFHEHPTRKMHPKQQLEKYKLNMRNQCIYIEFRYLLEEEGMKKIQAYEDLAFNYDVSQEAIRKVLRKFLAA